MRVFLSLSLSKDAIEEIKKIQDALAEKNLFHGKFTEGKNLHLTLKFFGEIDDSKVMEIKSRLKSIKLKKLSLKLESLGAFSESVVRIIWVGLAGAGKLQKEIDEVLSDLFPCEERFMGHLTIARVKNVFDKKRLLGFLKGFKVEGVTFTADRFYLMKSRLLPKGPEYSVIEEFSLS